MPLWLSKRRGLVQIFLGLWDRVNRNEGMEQLAKQLRAIRVFTAGGELGYRVRLYESTPPNIQNDGSGRASDEFDDAIFDGVQDFAILGHSYGGGATYLLADNIRYATNPGGIVANLRFTGYVDAIKLRTFGRGEERLPPNSLWNANYYQRRDKPQGRSIPTSSVNHHVTDADHGGNVVHHQNIDDTPFVHQQILNGIMLKMPLNDIH